MNCRCCAYHYADRYPDGTTDGIPYCHYNGPEGEAPCDLQDDECEPED